MADDFERLCLAVANTELPCLSRTALGFVLGGPEDVRAIVLAVLREMREPSAALLEHVAMFGFRETHGGPVSWRDLGAAHREYHIAQAQMKIERLIDALIAQADGGKR